MNLNDKKLEFLSQKYNISHAIIFVETVTNKNIIYSNNKYKIIEF